MLSCPDMTGLTWSAGTRMSTYCLLAASLGLALASSNSLEVVDDITQSCLETTTGAFKAPVAQGVLYFLDCLRENLEEVC